MGIAVEPVEPCYDSDCYYARGETLTWWRDYGYESSSPSLISYEPSLYEPPQYEPPWYKRSRYKPPKTDPPPPAADSRQDFPPIVHSSPSPPSSSGGQTGGEDSAPSPLPVPETGDPLYRAIGSLLSSRPAPAQTTPVVVQGRPTNPWPIALVGLAAVGAVAYVLARRKR